MNIPSLLYMQVSTYKDNRIKKFNPVPLKLPYWLNHGPFTSQTKQENDLPPTSQKYVHLWYKTTTYLQYFGRNQRCLQGVAVAIKIAFKMVIFNGPLLLSRPLHSAVIFCIHTLTPCLTLFQQ